ncbi:MAG: hypothetical protein HYW24_02825 [Candidatus Aenigmarchaeota archaeon]|nr:hypothetical protein [Candidatus Aenigmarchaeota archaeon]
MTDSDEIRPAFKLIEDARNYEKFGDEAKAIGCYLEAGDMAREISDDLGYLIFPQIYKGLGGRMKAIWEEYLVEVGRELSQLSRQ